MTGNELKIKLKELNLTQEKAAQMLGITRATLNNWCKQAELPIQIVKNIKTVFNIQASEETSVSTYQDIIRSQQRTIENLSETIKNLTSK